MRFTIRQARTHAGLTQAQTARMLGIDRGTYIKIEKDISRATVRQIIDISRITKIPLKDFFLENYSTLVEFDSEAST